MLDPKYQQMLSEAVDYERIKEKDYVLENPKLEEVIKFIKESCPEKFHSDQSIRDRVFYDEPAAHKTPIYNSGYIRPLPRLNRY